MARPQISVGQGIKVYRAPTFGRADGIVLEYASNTGTVTARLVKSKVVVSGLKYRTDAAEGEDYWVELPDGYDPGSEGH